MVNLACLLAQAPNGLWEKIIMFFNSAFGNYAVAIILITVIIKVLLLPTDYLNKRASNKMTEVQTRLQPKIDNIKRKYNDKNVQNQKINELYQKEGFNPAGSCLTTLISLAISMTVFLTLFSSLNNMAAYKIVDQYEKLQVAYVQEYAENNNLDISKQENINQIVLEITEGDIKLNNNETRENIVEKANINVQEKYKDVKESFLWIKNVWIADSPMQRAIPSFEKYASLAKLSFENTEEGNAKKLEAEKVYNAVMGKLEKEQGINGYFLLSILTAVTAFMYQYLLTKKKQSKQSETQPAQSGKAMLFVIPLIMLVFTLSYTSVFSIYIVIGQLFGMATAPLINYLLNRNKQKKIVEAPVNIVDIEPVTENTNTQNNSKEKKTVNNQPVSSNKNKKNTKTKGKAIKYPKKNKKGV